MSVCLTGYVKAYGAGISYPLLLGLFGIATIFYVTALIQVPEILKAQLLSKLRIVYVPICHQRYRRARHFIVFYITAYRISDAGSFGICGEPYCNFISVVYHFAVHSSHPAGGSFLVCSFAKKDGRGEPRKRKEKILP